MQAFLPRLLSRCRVDVLAAGNITSESAAAFAKGLEEQLSQRCTSFTYICTIIYGRCGNDVRKDLNNHVSFWLALVFTPSHTSAALPVHCTSTSHIWQALVTNLDVVVNHRWKEAPPAPCPCLLSCHALLRCHSSWCRWGLPSSAGGARFEIDKMGQLWGYTRQSPDPLRTSSDFV